MIQANYTTFTDQQLKEELDWFLSAYKGKDDYKEHNMYIAITAEIKNRSKKHNV